MSNELSIALVQTSLHWENDDANLNMLDERLLGLAGKSDIIVLPEMFSTGFSMNAENLAEEMHGKSVQWMIEKSRQLNSVITGSLIIKEKEHYFNRLVWAQPDGIIFHYDKRHLFSMAGEEKVYSPGNKKLIIEYKDWKICPLICFDLRFPVWIRNVEEYDALIFVANWPERRIQHWRKLLAARAIENQSYVIGVNRVGEDGNEFGYTGHSAAIDPMGDTMIEIENEEKTVIVTLIKEEVIKLRRYMQFLRERDNFKIL